MCHRQRAQAQALGASAVADVSGAGNGTSHARTRAAALGLALLAGLAAERAAGAPVAIGVRWAEGQTLTYRLTRETRLLHSSSPGFVAGPPLPRDVRSWTLELRPMEAGPTGATVEVIVRSVRFEDEGPDRPATRFDTADPSGRGPFDPLHSFNLDRVLVGVPLTARYAADGRFLSLAGAERVGDHVASALGVAGTTRPAELRSLREEFADGGDLGPALARGLALFAGTPEGIGSEWTVAVEERHLLSGRARTRHHFRLQSLDPAGAARVSVHIEAERDASGAIPWDEGGEGEDDAEEYTRALDTFSGDGSVEFDLALGHVRRYESVVRAAWTNRPDADVPYERVEEEVETRHTLERLDARGPRAPVPVVRSAPPPPALLAFTPYREALEKRCWVQARGASTSAMKGAEAEKARCLRRAFVAELDRILVPMKGSDPQRFAAAMAEQATWNGLVAAACPFFDEVQFADLDAGEWGFGTIYGLGQTACEQHAFGERAFLAAALRTGEIGLLVARIEEAAPEAEKARAELASLRAGLARWREPRPSSAEARRPVTPEDVRRLTGMADAIDRDVRVLAEASCTNWPALEKALGGPAPCVRAMESYYRAHR